MDNVSKEKALLDNVRASVEREVAQAKLDFRQGLISIETLQRVYRSLDNVRAAATFEYNHLQGK